MKKAFILFLVFIMLIFPFQSCVNSPKESDVSSEDNSKTEDETIKIIVEKGDNGSPSSYIIPPEAYLFGLFEVISIKAEDDYVVSELELIEVYAQPSVETSNSDAYATGDVFTVHEPYRLIESDDGQTIKAFNVNNPLVKIGVYLPFAQGRRYVASVLPSSSASQTNGFYAAPAFDFISGNEYSDFAFISSEASLNPGETIGDIDSKTYVENDEYKINMNAIKLIFESFEPHYDEGKKPDVSEVINAIDEWVEKAKE